jgi:hypothetical protein
MGQKGPAIFLVYTDLADEKYDEEFNAWYNTEHLPTLLKLPGFLDGARYVATKGGPKYLAVYEIESPEVVQSPDFTNRARPAWDRRMSPTVIGQNLTRVLGQQIFPSNLEDTNRGMAPALQIGRMSVSDEIDADWNAWYNGQYIPGYRTVPGVIYARRYRVVEGATRYTTVYELENDKVSETDEWNHQRVHSSPISEAMRDVMQMADGSPGVYRRIDV